MIGQVATWMDKFLTFLNHIMLQSAWYILDIIIADQFTVGKFFGEFLLFCLDYETLLYSYSHPL